MLFRSLRSFLVVAFLFLSAGSLLAACGETDASRAGAEITVEDFQLTRLEDGTRLFTGKLYNPTEQRVRGAQISITLLDAENRRVGTTSISVRDIVAGDTTSFRQPLDSEEEVSGARVKSITVL